MTMIPIAINGIIHIDTALNAKIEHQPDGLYLRAVTPVPSSSPRIASVPSSSPRIASVPELTPVTDLDPDLDPESEPKSGSRKRQQRPKRAQEHIELALSGMGPFELCKSRNIAPLTLLYTLSGYGSYEGKGGSPEIWAEYKAAHEAEWNVILATVGMQIPDAAVEAEPVGD